MITILHTLPNTSDSIYNDVPIGRSPQMRQMEFFTIISDLAGLILSGEGYQIDQSITEAISKFPTPSNRTDLHSFLRLNKPALHKHRHSCTTSGTTLPPPQHKERLHIWSANHNQAFNTAKSSLTKAPILSFFDASKSTCQCTDVSRQGLGFILQ